MSSFDSLVPGGQDLILSLDEVRRFAQSVGIPFVSGALLDNGGQGFFFETNELKQISHGLGRPYRGFFAINVRAPSTYLGSLPYIDTDAESGPSVSLPIRSRFSLTCDFWVY